MIKGMGVESSVTIMVINMRVSGRMTKCTVKVHTIDQMGIISMLERELIIRNKATALNIMMEI